jgi:tetratricopeptide (TPR) repeat protein
MATNLHLDREILLYERGRYEQAIQELARARVENSDNTYAGYLQAFALYQLNRPLDTLSLCEEILSLNPDYAPCHWLRGWCLLALQIPTEALQAMQDAVRLDPNDSRFWFGLGTIRLLTGQFHAALSDAETGLSLNPTDEICLGLRVQCLMHLARTTDLPAAVQAVLQSQPDSASAHEVAGLAMLQTGKHRQAEQFFQEAIRINPVSNLAEVGLRDSIKAKNLIYRLFLRYMFWQERLPYAGRAGLVFGQLLVIQLLGAAGLKSNNPYFIAVGAVVSILLILSFLIEPTFAILLAFDPDRARLLPYRPRLLYQTIPFLIVSGILLASLDLFSTQPPVLGWTGTGLLCLMLAMVVYDWAETRSSVAVWWPRLFAGLFTLLLLVAIVVQLTTRLGLLVAGAGIIIGSIYYLLNSMQVVRDAIQSLGARLNSR